ncbi:MAG TPA: DNA polymerase III subunit gamma/tau [Candidatus Saccharimonadales bacterium]|nr:DNA polymerase III subunit gamma/tau [Candidatus Saccharimonadales bacterium]
MSYQVIARKYRPQRFEDVVGQEHVTQTLANAIAQKRIAHAYLFVGPRGTGKTTVARIFAKCLNATDGPRIDFPEDDPKTKEIAEGRSMDVMEIDGASNRGIDEVRELRETVKYMPASSRFKIYIIDEVHMLTKEAFNALLKTLEEPPPHVKFMFATTEPEKVLPTILSRCQRFDLRRIPSALIVKHLDQIARQEEVRIDQAALHAIARGADGGMRDAESTLDQLISYCGKEIAEPDVLAMFGLASQGQILALAEAVLNGETETALRLLHDLAHQGKDLARLVSELLSHFRNLLIFQVSRGDLKLIEASETEAAALSEQSTRINSDGLTRIMEVLTDCEGRLRDTASKKILVEITLLKMIEARHAVSIDTVLKQVQQLRAEAAGAAPVAAAPRTPASAPTAIRPAPVAAMQVAAVGETDLSQLWIKLVEAVGRASPFIRTYFTEAHPVSLTRNLLTIGFDPEFATHLPLVDNSRNHALIQTKLAEMGHPQVQVKFIQADAPPQWKTSVASLPSVPEVPSSQSPSAPAKPVAAPVPAAKPEPAAASTKVEFKNDPLIQKALEVFKGQIVEVRS